jgi:hypothetical protein
MQKIQILFPDPVMERLRAVARHQDRPVSELVRRAVDRLLEQVPVLPPKQPARFPTFHGGGVLVEADRLRDVLHGVDDEGRTASGNEHGSESLG